MLTSLREKLLEKFEELIRLLSVVLVPLGKNGRVFRRYRVLHRGWIWFVIPRIELEQLDLVDLTPLTEKSVDEKRIALEGLAADSAVEIREGIRRSAVNRAGRTRTRIDTQIRTIVEKGGSFPSTIVTNGRIAIQTVHRTLIESVAKVTKERFEAAIKKTLAQMLAYAREEAGSEIQQTSALPFGTRFVYKGDPYSLYVIEEAPRVRTVLWDGNKHTLSFPYVVFCLYLHQGSFSLLQVFFRNAPLTKPTDELGLPPLPDIMERREGVTGP